MNPQTDEERVALVADVKTISDAKTALAPTSTVSAAADAARLVAEIAKCLDTRKPLADAGFLPLLVNRLDGISDSNEINVELDTQILRALGNLCFDNEDNRDNLLEVPETFPAVTKRLLLADDPRLLQIACGALLNISMENEAVQLKIIESGGISGLVRVMKLTINDSTSAKYGHLATSCITTLSNLLEVEQGIQSLCQSDGLVILFQVLKREHDFLTRPDVSDAGFSDALDVLESVVSSLEYIGENDTVQRLIVSHNLLHILLDFVDHRPPFLDSLPISSDTNKESLSEVYSETRKRISRIVTLVTMNDANMLDIPNHNDVMARFKQWMTLGHNNDDKESASLHAAAVPASNALLEDEVRMSGALCVGNLARSDESCKALVEKHGVVPALLVLLDLETRRVKAAGEALGDSGAGSGDDDRAETTTLQQSAAASEIKSCVKVIHAVVGAIKNLSISVGDRKALGALGVIKPVAALLDMDLVKPVHFACIGILKNLCAAGNELNAYRIITGLEPPVNETKVAKLSIEGITPQSKTPLNKLIKCVWKATGDNLTNVRNEGGRVVVNLVRTSHLAGAPHLINMILESNGITLLIQIVTGALLTRVNDDQQQGGSQPELHHHVHFDAVPSDGQVFPVVQNEGLVALILMANALQQTAVPIIVKYHTSLLPISKKILLSGLPSDEIPDSTPSSSSSQTPLASDDVLYSDEVKVNCCLFLGVLASADVTFSQLAAPIIKPILDKLMKWTSNSNLIAATAASERSAIAFQEAANRGSSSALPRSGTKSAKRVGGANDTGVLQTADSVEDGLRLVDAVKRLKSLFEK